MLRTIGQWIKALIAGWFISAILFLVKRIINRAMRNMAEAMEQADPNYHDGKQNPYQNNPYATRQGSDVVDTIWAGMSAVQLQQSFGTPTLKRKTGPNIEVWAYPVFGGKAEPTDVTLQNGFVTGWDKATPERLGHG